MSELHTILNCYTEINLSEIDRVKLLNRVDNKYVVQNKQLVSILKDCENDYYVLLIDNDRMFSYHTTYFDTDDFQMFQAHQRGLLSRSKVRLRRYLNTGEMFFEIKKKTNTRRTIKKRIKLDEFNSLQNSEISCFIDKYASFSSLELKPKIDTRFNRITLVSKDFKSRITIDLDVKIENSYKCVSIKDVSIVEVKREKSAGVINMDKILRDYGISAMSFSKYCIGVCFLYPEIKNNNFLHTIKMLKRNNYVDIT